MSNWQIDAKPSFVPIRRRTRKSMGRRRSSLDLARRPWRVDHRLHGLLAQRTLVSLAETKDFTSSTRLGPAMPRKDKTRPSFPAASETGTRCCIARCPQGARCDIWISFSPDLTHWGDHHILMHARRGAWGTQQDRLSSPPLETPEGWLILYHGVRVTAGGCLYRLGLAYRIGDPCRVLRRSDEWIFVPELPYERQGDVNGVVFPCGWILDQPSGEIRLYYGGADTWPWQRPTFLIC